MCFVGPIQMRHYVYRPIRERVDILCTCTKTLWVWCVVSADRKIENLREMDRYCGITTHLPKGFKVSNPKYRGLDIGGRFYDKI